MTSGGKQLRSGSAERDRAKLWQICRGKQQLNPPVIEKQPWLKFIVGADYTFANGTYLIQYLHGFFHERGKGNLNDYLILSLEKDFFNGQLHIRPLAGGMAVSDWKEPSQNYAIFYTPEVFYRGIDNFEIGLGAYIFAEKGDGIFAGLKEMDMLQVKAKLSF